MRIENRSVTTMALLIWVVVAVPLAVPFGASGDEPAAGNRPNILLILADDLGYSDPGCYGGEIETPHLNELANEGLRFTRFANAGKCAPTRAAMLTGLYPQQVGSHGPPRHNQWPRSVTAAEVLKDAGYQTFMVGKWHGRKNRAPLSNGFDRFYGFVDGNHDYFSPGGLRLDEEAAPQNVDSDFYLTDAFGEYAVKFLRGREDSKRPFFLYAAYNAPHYPLQAPEDLVAKYEDRYMRGWDRLRQRRFDRQRALGVVREAAELSPRDPDVPSWQRLGTRLQVGQPPRRKVYAEVHGYAGVHKTGWAHRMATYAAMVERMDHSIGRILEELRRQGELSNTLVLFLSDNGATNEFYGDMSPDERETLFQGEPWANLSNTPYRWYKRWVHAGGVRTPLIAHWPGVIEPGRITRQPGHVIDVMATCLDVAGVEYPERWQGEEVLPLEGRSLVPIFRGENREGHEAQFWYFQGSAAVRHGRWKLVSAGNGRPWPSEPPPAWQLYDLKKDPSELKDLAAEKPERVKQLEARFKRWAERCGVTGNKYWQMPRVPNKGK